MKKAREEGKIAFFKQTKLIIKERGDQARGDVTRFRTAGAGNDGVSKSDADSGGAVRPGARIGGDVPSSASADGSAAFSAVLRGSAALLSPAVGGIRNSSPGGAGVRGSAVGPEQRQQHRTLRNRNK